VKEPLFHSQQKKQNNVWFAILEGIVVASGSTRGGVEQILQEIIPAEKRELVYVFHLRK